ncbi:LIM/homeobox protein Lhx9 [Orussus abietinus]|uniref:LIM/homeobox protein Lhx9 n=1 Tax=Orussus abietinus TaxID=222816 RepID=UPI000C71609F|nr:LIM/homeobox protein Lhx9 [Orussus abietinus]
MLKEVGCGAGASGASGAAGGGPAAEGPGSALGCGGCGREICERWYLRAADRAWHCGCLRCCHCRLPLAAELTCFARDGNIYCKEDYYRLFAVSRCARCRAGISASELVMRARDLVYHVACFTCASCGTPLNKGDHFGQREGLVYCRPHYELVCCAADYGSASGSAEDSLIGSPGVSPVPAYYGVAEQSPHGGLGGLGALGALGVPGAAGPGQAAQKGRPRKRKLSEAAAGSDLPVTMRLAAGALELLHPSELSSSMESLSAYEASSVGSPGSVHQSQRTKRMRTSFKHHQLRTMKSYFAINQNPDAKDLKQLAQKTGLSKRVLQVWFQNARAKWRRNMLRQEGGVGNSGNGAGTPAASGADGSPPVGPGPAHLADGSGLPPASIEELHALRHLHPGRVTFSGLY